MELTKKEENDFLEMAGLLSRLSAGELSDKEHFLERLFEELGDGDEDEY